MKQLGFSLVECMVYCMVTAILFTTWFHGIVITNARFNQVSGETVNLSNFYAAQDLLVRDIRQAPAERKQWKKLHSSILIWQTEDGDIGWHVHDDKLVRIQGTYDMQKNMWHKKKTGLAALHVERINFNYQVNKEIVNSIGFEITMDNKQSVKTTVNLCNGVCNG